MTNIYLRTQTSYKQLRSDVKKKINMWCLWYTPKTGGGGSHYYTNIFATASLVGAFGLVLPWVREYFEQQSAP